MKRQMSLPQLTDNSIPNRNPKRKFAKPSLDSIVIDRINPRSDDDTTKTTMEDKENFHNLSLIKTSEFQVIHKEKIVKKKQKPALLDENLYFHPEDSPYDEQEDEEEEQQLITVMKKIKETQTAQSDAQRRKRNRELMESSQQQFTQEVKQLIARHNRRWNTKQSELQNKGKRLKEQVESFQKQMKVEGDQYNAQLEKTIHTVNQIKDRLQRIENHHQTSFHENELKIDYETKGMKMEINQKLEDMHQHLEKVYQQTCKDDKLTKLVKTFISAL